MAAPASWGYSPRMLVVKTEIRKSPIHGVGVFALEDIKEGQLVYKWNPKVDRVYSWEDVQKLTGKQRELMNRFAMKEGKDVHLDGDNSHFMNHSDNPNMAPFPDNDTWFATRDIKKGEEIVCSYRHFDDALSARGVVER